MSSLDYIGLKYGTDKASNGHGYLNYYDDLFFKYRGKEITLWEIGVQGGKSLRMWEEYFPFAKIVGIDCDERCREYATDRIKIHTGRQEDFRFLGRVCLEEGAPDIVIDDGGHIGREQLETFKSLFPLTQKLYIVEDLHTVNDGGGSEFLDHAVKIVRDWVPVGSENLLSVEFRHNLCVFRRK